MEALEPASCQAGSFQLESHCRSGHAGREVAREVRNWLCCLQAFPGTPGKAEVSVYKKLACYCLRRPGVCLKNGEVILGKPPRAKVKEDDVLI